MATFTINSKIYGEQVFTCGTDRSYVRLNGKQICSGGHMSGSTITATAADLEATARKWWAQHLRITREFR